MIDAATESIITLSEAGRRLGKTRQTVAAYVRAGKLDAVSIDGRPHTSLEALRRFAAPISPTVAVDRRQLSAKRKQIKRELAEMGML